MSRVSQSMYQRYLDAVKKEQEQRRDRTSGAESGKIAESIFSEIIDFPVPDRMDMVTAEDFKKHPIKKGLDSLRVNGKPMFAADEVTRENYHEKIAEAVKKIAPAMVNTNSARVPYMQKADGTYEAIAPKVPNTPEASSIQIPEKPAFYKRWLKGIRPAWKREVEAYDEAVAQKESAEKAERLGKYSAKLEERAGKRELQDAAYSAAHTKEWQDKEIEVFFGSKPNEEQFQKMQQSVAKGFPNIGRPNVPLGLAVGMIMAEQGIGFDEALKVDASVKQFYGDKVLAMQMTMAELNEEMKKIKPPYKDSEKEVKKLTDVFKESVAPHLTNIISAYGAESLHPIDTNSAASIRENGSRNNILTSCSRGIAQMLSVTFSASNEACFPYAAALGEMIQEQAMKTENSNQAGHAEVSEAQAARWSEQHNALKACINPIIPESRKGRRLQPEGDRESWSVFSIYKENDQAALGNALDAVDYSMNMMNTLAGTNTMVRAEYTYKLFNSAIEGTAMDLEEEIDLGNMVFRAEDIGYKVIGLHSIPESILQQTDMPAYSNAYVRDKATEMGLSDYSSMHITWDAPDRETKYLEQLEACQNRRVPESFKDQESPDNKDTWKAVKTVEAGRVSMAGNESARRRTSLAEMGSMQAATPQNPRVQGDNTVYRRNAVRQMPQRSKTGPQA